MLPHRRIVIDTWLAPEQVVYSLSAATEPRRLFRLDRGTAVFEGQVENRQFRLNRIIGYSNSWIPQLKGEIEPMQPTGTRILVRAAPHPAVTAFSLLFVAIALGVAAVMPTEPTSWILVVFGVLLPTIAYGLEARLTMRAFRKVISRAEQMWADNMRAQ